MIKKNNNIILKNWSYILNNVLLFNVYNITMLNLTTHSKIRRYTKIAVPRAWVAVVTRANLIPAYTVVHHLAVGVGDARVTKSWEWNQFLNVKWQIQCKHIIISCEHINIPT